jgi:hypothetical protein
MGVDGLALHNKSHRQKQGDIYARVILILIRLCFVEKTKKKSPGFTYDLCVDSYFSKSMKYSLHFEL